MPNINWIEIKNEYIFTDISQRKLAEKYGVSVSTLMKRANKEQWKELKASEGSKMEASVHQKTAEIISDDIVEKTVNRVETVLSLSDELTNKLKTAISELGIGYEDEHVPINTKDIKRLVSSLKDLSDIIKNNDITDSSNEKMEKLIQGLKSNE